MDVDLLLLEHFYKKKNILKNNKKILNLEFGIYIMAVGIKILIIFINKKFRNLNKIKH